MCEESSNKGVNSNYVALSFLGRWASYNRKSQPRNSDKLYEQVLIACKQEAMNGKKKDKKKNFPLVFHYLEWKNTITCLFLLLHSLHKIQIYT